MIYDQAAADPLNHNKLLHAEIERLRAALVLAEAALADIGDGEGPVYDRISKVNRSWSLYQAEKRALQALPAVRDALAARDDNLIQGVISDS